MHQTEGQVEVFACGKGSMMCPDGQIVFLHQFGGSYRDLSAARYHPGHYAHTIREYYGALGCHLPQFSGEYLILQRKHEGQRNDIGGMCMIYHTVVGILQLLHFQIHQVAGELGGRSAPVYQTPYDTVILTLVVKFDHADRIFRLNADITKIFATAGHQEILSCQCGNCGADGLELLRLKVLLYQFYLFRLHTVRQVAAVTFMPALLPAVICHSDKSLYKFCI